jgi:ATP-binding cassette, subfamily B (MDR/TAP), member 1
LATNFLQKFLFGIIGENIAFNIRQKLYSAILKKHMGWFDARENAPGVLSSILAKDVQALNGASSEGSAVILESAFALIGGIAIGLGFNWKLGLVSLGGAPFMALGGFINAKLYAGYSNLDGAAHRAANLLAGDTILNYRTVASFGHDYLIIREYD